MNSAIEGKCQSCTEQAARYRCPACSVQSCSLPCVQAHKERTACTGKRARAAHTFTPASRLNEEILLDDQLLLDEARSSIGGYLPACPASVPHKTQQGPPRRLLEFQKKCRERQINLALMPSGMARSQSNRSRILAGSRLLWTIEWIIVNGPTPEHPLYMRLDELQSCARHPRYTTALETDSVTMAYNKLLSDSSVPKDVSSVQLFLRLEADRPRDGPGLPPPVQGFDVSPSKRLWPIHNPQTTLDLLLLTRTIIEFPTIYIYIEEAKPGSS